MDAFLPCRSAKHRAWLRPRHCERHCTLQSMPVQNKLPCRLRTTAGAGPRLGRGAGDLRRARPRQRGRAPSAVPQPPLWRQTQPQSDANRPPHPPRVRQRRRTGLAPFEHTGARSSSRATVDGGGSPFLGQTAIGAPRRSDRPRMGVRGSSSPALMVRMSRGRGQGLQYELERRRSRSTK